MKDTYKTHDSKTPEMPIISVSDGTLESDDADEAASCDGSGGRVQVVAVSVQQAVYGIRIDTVREILRVRKITWIPWTPEYVIGILNVRGEMLSIVDLRLFLQHGASDVTDGSRIIVIESKDLVAGLLVDAMVDILEIPIAAFHPLADGIDHDDRVCAVGQLCWQDMTLTLLDSDRLLQGIVVNQA